MCTSPVQPICTFSCTAHFISLHILPLILFHYLFLISFSPYLYIYILSRVLFHSFYCFYVIFILLSCFIFLSCTFHWADLSWLTFHYLLYPVWLCMWQIIKNLEPCFRLSEENRLIWVFCSIVGKHGMRWIFWLTGRYRLIRIICSVIELHRSFIL